jgi:predicted nuclease of predicted toxin-antitoxin system
MKFIVDAQLPKRLSVWIAEQGYDCIHTLDLPDKNLTSDSEVIRVSLENNRIVVSKDSDFYEHFVVYGTPKKLLMICLGNIVNKKLIELFEQNFETMVGLLNKHHVVEINNEEIVVHY